jgi:hypothetical protein
MGLPFELLERRGRGRGLRMRVGGRGGRRCQATDVLVAPAPPTGPICPEHGPGPWLPWFCVEHGHGPCPPPTPVVAGPSNWAAPEPMEPTSPTLTPSFTVAGLRRARSRSPPTMVARRSTLTRGDASSSRAVDDAPTPPPPPPSTAPIPRRVHAGEAANRRPGLRRTLFRVPHGPSARGLPNGHVGPSENDDGGAFYSPENGESSST